MVVTNFNLRLLYVKQFMMIGRTMMLSILILCFHAGHTQDCPQMARDFFVAVKQGNVGSAQLMAKRLASVSREKLKGDLPDENTAKAFWINLYNTYVQHLLKVDPGLFSDRDAFFQEKRFTIAGTPLSFDDVEHGILRRSTNKYSFGYLASFSVSDFEKMFRLERVDYRIHFALNCGAKSCPPIDYYDAPTLDAQLDHATHKYLKADVRYDATKNEVHVPALCLWFKSDFGGKNGIVKIVHRFGLVPEKKMPEVVYLPYDWTLSLSQYTD